MIRAAYETEADDYYERLEYLKEDIYEREREAEPYARRITQEQHRQMRESFEKVIEQRERLTNETD